MTTSRNYHSKMTFYMTVVLATTLFCAPGFRADIQPDPRVLDFPEMVCNGTDRYVNFGFDFVDVLSNTFTMEFEVFPTGEFNGAQVQSVVTSGNILFPSGPFVNYTANGFITAGLFIDTGVDIIPVNIGVNIDSGVFSLVKVVAVEDGGIVDLSLCVNEFTCSSFYFSGVLNTPVDGLSICRHEDDFTTDFDGTVRNLRLYNLEVP